MMRTLRTCAPLFALSLAAILGCETSTEPNLHPDPGGEACRDRDKPGCVVASDKQRISTPDVPPEDKTALVSGNSAFALDLYQELRQEPGNVFYSPYSISTALAMTWAGAKGETETAMADTLRFGLGQDKLHPAFNWIDQELESRGQGAQGADGEGFRLNVVNALWGQIGYGFEAPFLDTLALNYGAGMRVVDFVGHKQEAVDLINGWVSDQTEGKIEKLVPIDAITPETVLVLTNAIYFNAAWRTPFEPTATADGPFEKADGTEVTVPLMHASLEMPYAEGDGYKAVAMPYDGDELSMVLVLPAKGTLDAFEASLDAAKVDGIVGAMSEHLVETTMPKFKFEYELSLKKTLEAMGMEIAFTSGVADFTGINAEGQPFIQDVLHKAFVGVNEAGTEAAAATAVIVGDESAPVPASLALVNPFLFLIRDNATGSLLFVGRVADPSAS
ncbi:serine protease [Sorangium cellulosum]|uniref:Serine protease n=1 Tax=Sorangium cellulosum TaxID=56 RepID=A0A150S553_SORCE|nr:serine protease [Sorangium cellulosum]KYF88667.1 serine protease [Sorangium cellulosum]